jgi:phage tail-like protein
MATAGSGRAPSPVNVVGFSLTIDGVEIAQFSELTSMSSEVEPIELIEGSGERVFLKKLPGKRKPPTVTLKRGISSDTSIAGWHGSVVEGDVAAARRDATLTMFAADGRPVAKYHLESAWRSKLEVGVLEGDGSGRSLHETVTLTCDVIRRVAP